jgi:hypothetical protein
MVGFVTGIAIQLAWEMISCASFPAAQHHSARPRAVQQALHYSGSLLCDQ